MKIPRKRSTSVSVAKMAGIAMIVIATGCSERADRTPAVGAQQSSPPTPEAKQSPPAGPGAAGSIELSSETPASLVAMQTAGVCSLENVVTIADNASKPGDMPNSYKVSRGPGYRLVGFATNKEKGVAPKEIRLILSGLKAYSIPVESERPREDVAKYFNNPAFANSGFMADADFSAVEPGDYAVYVLEQHGSESAACATNQAIEVL